MDKPRINLDDLKLDCTQEERRAVALEAKELIEANQRRETERLTNCFRMPSMTRFILLKDVANEFSRETSDKFFGGTFYNSLHDAATKCELAAYNPITGDRVLPDEFEQRIFTTANDVNDWLKNNGKSYRLKIGLTSNIPKPISPLTGSRYLQKPPVIPPANYEKWRKADLWTIERGILLLLNAEGMPSRNTYSTGRCNSDDEQRLYDEYMNIWEIAESSLKTGILKKIGKGYPNLQSEVLPGDFIQWAQSKGYQIPDELSSIELLSQIEPVTSVGSASFITDWYCRIGHMSEGISQTIGTEPVSINWEHWLSLPTWSKNEAVLLISGLNPNRFHEIESHENYQSICEPFIELCQRTIEETGTPYYWLDKFNKNGYLDCVPKGVQNWLTQQIEIAHSKTQADLVASDGGDSQGTEQNGKALTKLEKQQAAILEVIKAKQFKPMAIPDGEKGTIKIICETDFKVLFEAETAFVRAWKEGINKLWKMEHHESYAHRGK